MAEKSRNGLERILTVLHQQTAVDFGLYKQATLRRRIERRMGARKIKNPAIYANYLRANPAEVRALFEDLLIPVTSFFRDDSAFSSLKRGFLAELARTRPKDGPIRIWVPACSTGEEVYSIAILLAEQMEGKRSLRHVCIFGTDVNESVLAKARMGIFPESIRNQVSAERLRRFFEPVTGGYRVHKSIRELCVFARHNLAADPPFSNLDLISCRNVLIYFSPELQKKLVPVFHFALKPSGRLFLGASEAIETFSKLFLADGKTPRLYRRNPAEKTAAIRLIGPPTAPVTTKARASRSRVRDLASVDLSAAVAKIMRRHPDLRTDRARVFPVTLPDGRQEVYLVLPEEKASSARAAGAAPARPKGAEGSKAEAEIKRLRRELLALRASLHGILEQAEAANEELRAANEEVVSSNEELQSANEELETAKEELQSTNEELATANEELETRNTELEQASILSNRFHAIVESSADAIISKDLNGIVQTWNKGAEAVFGYTANEMIGKPVSLLIPVDRPDEEPSILARLRAGQTIEHYDTIRQRKDGQRIAISLSVSPVRDTSGKIVAASKIARDVTDKKRLEFELDAARHAAEQANHAKDDFLAALSHELRTPLSPILLVASDAAADANLSADRRADFELIRSYAEIEARLIDDLLDLTRIATGKLKVEKREVDAQAVLLSSVAMIRREAERKGLDLAQRSTAAQAVVYGDSVRLHQIFSNVLNNAVKFTPSPGRITVEARLDEGKYVVKVSDTGIGMTRQELAFAFDAFRQGTHSPKRRSPGGLGLGLTISRKLVDFHSGTIEAASPGRDAGTTFTIALPLAESGREVAAAESPREAVGKGAPAPEGARILLVEDDEGTRTALARLLAARRYDVVAAASVAEALAAAEKAHFDLVISDIGLPDGDGHELFQELRRRTPSIRGIALTGYGMSDDVARASTSGFGAHLTKPVNMQELEAAFAKVLQS